MTTRHLLKLALMIAPAMAACDLLDVSDPTATQEEAVSNAAGAGLLRGAALNQASLAIGTMAGLSGVLSDEFFAHRPSGGIFGWAEDFLDRRSSLEFEQGMQTIFGDFNASMSSWQTVRLDATVAAEKLREFGTPAMQPQAGEMLALRGYATLRIAENICPGFPLHDVVNLNVIISGPLTTEEGFNRALADIDSSLALATDSARILNLVRVLRGRTLLDLGRYADAAAAVAGVPTSFVQNHEFSASVYPPNPLDVNDSFFSQKWRGVSNNEGGTGLNYVSANDPRVRLTDRGLADDAVTRIYAPSKYPTQGSPIVMVSGIEARLIEAEAALHANSASWLSILNNLRATAISPGMVALSDPGTAAARVDLLFRERAFWLFATGSRLADMRRLIRQYSRTANSVFPTGTAHQGGTYGTATTIPFSGAAETPHNPAVTGCTER